VVSEWCGRHPQPGRALCHSVELLVPAFARRFLRLLELIDLEPRWGGAACR
jgi:hypothetical protein